MGFDIRLHPNAVKFLKGLDKDTGDRIKSALRNLENDPFRKIPKADIEECENHCCLNRLVRFFA
jgi:mRNA interferase RelE/StbE